MLFPDCLSDLMTSRPRSAIGNGELLLHIVTERARCDFIFHFVQQDIASDSDAFGTFMN